ncbi:MAG: amidohydrolase family protein, partial [Candidatus Bathyarchaeota archaeon]|nr:amidohydrolase family protein [Candidatus Bathyarchaeota archaeon]
FGVKVSLGHTDATYEQALSAIKAGANIITHLFNGMRGYHHREPGIIGAALTTDVYAEVIVDFIHLHPATVDLTVKCKGPGKTILVSDATPGAGLPDGIYTLGPSKVIVRDGVARTEEGGLAGSTLMLINAVRNMVRIGLPLNDAFRMATSTPCDAMCIKGLGRVARGCRADLLILNKRLEILEIYSNGEICEIN